MILPDCLVVGPPRAGTTWIYRYLKWRGDVSLPRGVKETSYFDRRYSRGLKWYADHFKGCEPGNRVVEVGPTYFSHQEAPERVLRCLGPIQIICTLRDPVKRTYSFYLHMLRYGMTRYDFKQALEAHAILLDSSRYATHLSRWKEEFGKDNVCVLLQDDLKNHIMGYVQTLDRFLELKHIGLASQLYEPANIATLPTSPFLASIGQSIVDWLRNYRLYSIMEFGRRIGLKEVFFGKPGKKPIPELAPALENQLRTYFLPEVEALEEMLGKDLSSWK